MTSGRASHIFFGELEQLHNQVGNVLLNKEVRAEVCGIDLLQQICRHHSVSRDNRGKWARLSMSRSADHPEPNLVDLWCGSSAVGGSISHESSSPGHSSPQSR